MQAYLNSEDEKTMDKNKPQENSNSFIKNYNYLRTYKTIDQEHTQNLEDNNLEQQLKYRGIPAPPVSKSTDEVEVDYLDNSNRKFDKEKDKEIIKDKTTSMKNEDNNTVSKKYTNISFENTYLHSIDRMSDNLENSAIVRTAKSLIKGYQNFQKNFRQNYGHTHNSQKYLQDLNSKAINNTRYLHELSTNSLIDENDKKILRNLRKALTYEHDIANKLDRTSANKKL